MLVDCEKGRQRGCQSFCCRLVVRLRPGEVEPGGNSDPLKSCIDKDPTTGMCVYFDATTSLCAVWTHRPQDCRDYTCTHDPRLQVVLREGFVSLTRLAQAARELAEPSALNLPRTPD